MRKIENAEHHQGTSFVKGTTSVHHFHQLWLAETSLAAQIPVSKRSTPSQSVQRNCCTALLYTKSVLALSPLLLNRFPFPSIVMYPVALELLLPGHPRLGNHGNTPRIFEP